MGKKSALDAWIGDREKRYRKLVGFDSKYNWYSYSSHTGKFSVSNILVETLVRDFKPIEVTLFFEIMSKVKRSSIYSVAGMVTINRKDYPSKYKNVIKPALQKFVDFGFLEETPKYNVYGIHPLYVNKFSKTKEIK